MDNATAQANIILDHMKTIGAITRIEAMNIYGIGNITARITDLRQRGHKIQTIKVKGVNRYGRKINYARWILLKEA